MVSVGKGNEVIMLDRRFKIGETYITILPTPIWITDSVDYSGPLESGQIKTGIGAPIQEILMPEELLTVFEVSYPVDGSDRIYIVFGHKGRKINIGPRCNDPSPYLKRVKGTQE